MIPRFSGHPAATYLLILICVLWALISGLEFSFYTVPQILSQGGNFAPYTLGAEPWRLLTSLFAHGGFIHLLLNMLALYSLGRAVEPVTGPLGFLALFLVTGIAGNLVSLYWNLFSVSVGASGAIFGIFGFDMVLTIIRMRDQEAELWRTILTAGIYVALILLIGMVFPFDNAAHLGGLLCGLAIGTVYAVLPAVRPLHLYLMLSTLLVVIYFVLPRFQVVHFNQFRGLEDTEEKSQELAASFTSDEEASKGFLRIRESFDSIAQLFADTLDNAPASVIEDRNSLYQYARKKERENAYKAKLVDQHSYRYMDSIELVQSIPIQPLNHPLAFETNETPPPPPPREVHRTWYDDEWKEVRSAAGASYYRLGYKDSLGRWDGRVEDYYINGGIQMKGVYQANLRNGIFRYYSQDSTYTACGEYDNEIRVGYWEFFHENGRLSEVRNFADKNYLLTAWDEEGNVLIEDGNGELVDYFSNDTLKSFVPYRNGLVNGTAFGNYGTGTLKFREVFRDGVLIRGQSYKNNSTNSYDESTYYPFPVGGMENFNEYVKQETRESRLGKGTVRLLFTCPPSGDIYDIRVWKSASPAHDSTAVAILKAGPAWNPAREHGLEPYTSEGAVTITFE